MCDRNMVGLSSLRVPQVEAPSQQTGKRRIVSLNRVRGRFLRGPIPLSWLRRACGLCGPKVLPVALAIWFLAGLKGRKHDLTLTTATLEQLVVINRSKKSRDLDALEEAGLIEVRRQAGKNPRVTILDVAPGDLDTPP